MAKILVADDNSNIQKMVGLALKDQGIDVVAVGNGEAAVRKISDVKPDLVLADVFMPVRNGYEVCRYVKEDSSLSHIPVILLVGAFDPLDEQEAQRVGADGVLKKPFVPPDPLISMVKSALTRAGVAIGNEAEKVPEVAGTPTAKDLLTSGVSSKLAALSGSALPEAEAEPLEEFPTPPPSVKIAAGSEPVAFGSLLETSEEDMALVSKPIEELEQARNWDAGGADEVEEEEAEKESRGGWRSGALDEADEPAVPSGGSKVKDWREEAFQGNSPATISSGRGWSPVRTTQVAQVAEVAGAPASVDVSTMENKPSETPAQSPFAGDAWAAALANNVEHKIADVAETPVAENEAAAEVAATEPVAAPAPVVDEVQSAKRVMAPNAPATQTPSWVDASTSPWELEAKKASLLAATWDAPAPAPVPVESASVAEAEKFLAEEPASEAVSPFVEQAPARAEEMTQAPAAQRNFEAAQPETAEEPMAALTEEHVAQETSLESAYASGTPLDVNATQEVPVLGQEESHYSRAFLAEEPVEKTEAAVENAAPAAIETAPAPTATQQPDMDALVARVLAKMNPEVLQKVTQEILKPVIEAIIKDELNQKK